MTLFVQLAAEPSSSSASLCSYVFSANFGPRGLLNSRPFTGQISQPLCEA